MTGACDERSPREGGCEKEEPNEPPADQDDCRVRVFDGVDRLREALARVMPEIYKYNEEIKRTGYYLKPVHKVYKRGSDGRTRLYEYYGRYWWRVIRGPDGRKLVYVGREKPLQVKRDPPRTGLEGLSAVIEGRDVIVPCDIYDRFRDVFKGLKAVREWKTSGI